VKSIPRVHFINVLRIAFMHTDPKSIKTTNDFTVFFKLSGFVSVKSAYRTLIKLTPGVNFINVLRTAFTHVDPECAKKTVKSAVSFGAFGIYERKSCI